MGSPSYAKAALLFDVHRRRLDHDAKRDQGPPSAAMRTNADTSQQTPGLADTLHCLA